MIIEHDIRVGGTTSGPCCDYRGHNFPVFSLRGIPGFFFVRLEWLELSTEYFFKTFLSSKAELQI
jgi:hypothetical protein